jgi:hypothetical protein
MNSGSANCCASLLKSRALRHGKADCLRDLCGVLISFEFGYDPDFTEFQKLHILSTCVPDYLAALFEIQTIPLTELATLRDEVPLAVDMAMRGRGRRP